MRNREFNWLGDGRAMVHIQASGPKIPDSDHCVVLLILCLRSREESSVIITQGWSLCLAS